MAIPGSGIDFPSSRGVRQDFQLLDNTKNSTSLRVPRYPSATKPPSIGNAGRIIFDTTLGQLCYSDGINWICVAGSVPPGNIAGIVDCKIGNVSNPNVNFNSVQDAINAGCYSVRIVDGLNGGQFPGYTESAFNVTTLPPGKSMFIFVDAGVDWTFDLSVLGNRPVVIGNRNLDIQGASSIRSSIVITGSSSNEWVSSTSNGRIIFKNMILSIPDTASFPTTSPLNSLVLIESTVTFNTNTGSATVFDMVSTGTGVTSGAYVFSTGAFVGTAASSVNLFSDVPSGVLLDINDIQFGGIFSNITFATVTGSSGRIQINGIRINPNGVQLVTIGQRSATLPGGRVSVSQFQEVSPNPSVSLTLLNSVNIDNLVVDVCTVIGESNNITNSRANNMIVQSDSNVLSTFQFGNILVNNGANSNEFSNGKVQSSIDTTGSGISNKFSNIDSTPTGSIILGGQGSKISNSSANNLSIISSSCVISNTTLGNLFIDADEVQIIGCDIGGTTTIGTSAICPECIFSGNNFIGGVSHGIAFAAVNCSYSGNRFQNPGLLMNTRANADGCVLSGNSFVGGVTVGADVTATPPLFTGNSGTGAATGPANAHINSIGNT